jgi:hypothetical protein
VVSLGQCNARAAAPEQRPKTEAFWGNGADLIFFDIPPISTKNAEMDGARKSLPKGKMLGLLPRNQAATGAMDQGARTLQLDTTSRNEETSSIAISTPLADPFFGRLPAQMGPR